MGRHGRWPQSFPDIKKCKENIGKDVRLTLRSGVVITGQLYRVERVELRAPSTIIVVRVQEGSFAYISRRGVICEKLERIKSRFIEKYEYLWEVESGQE